MIRGISDRATFGRVRRNGHRHRTADLRVTFLPGSAGDLHVAYTIGRKVGSAVVRNRLRRRIRGVLDDHRNELPSGALVFGALPSAPGLSAAELRTQVEHVLLMINNDAATPPAGENGGNELKDSEAS